MESEAPAPRMRLVYVVQNLLAVITNEAHYNYCIIDHHVDMYDLVSGY